MRTKRSLAKLRRRWPHKWKNRCPNKAKCTNCGEGHMAGSNHCEIEIKERVFEKMRADSRVGRLRALQILAGKDESPKSNPQSYPKHFRFKMDPGKKIKFNPWAIKNCFTLKTWSKSATIRWNKEFELIIETSNEKESKIFPTLTSLCSPQFHERV